MGGSRIVLVLFYFIARCFFLTLVSYVGRLVFVSGVFSVICWLNQTTAYFRSACGFLKASSNLFLIFSLSHAEQSSKA